MSAASHFQKGRRGYATWRCANTKWTSGWQQLDHHVYPTSMRNCVQDVRVVQGTGGVETDHLLVKAKLKADSFGWYGKRKQRGKKATKIPKRVGAAQRLRYNERVQELHASGVELQESLRRAAADTFLREREEKPWISDEFREIWRERRTEHEKGNFEEARALLKLLKWIERRDREAYAEAACEEAEATFESTGLAPALTKISQLAGKRKRQDAGATRKQVQEPLSDASGTAYLASEKAELHRKFLAEVFTRPEPELLPERPAKARSRERNTGGPETAGPFEVGVTDGEIRAAVERLKPDRAAGEDTITKEHYELLDDVGKQLLVDQVRTYWEEGKLPAGVVDSLVVVLAKHGKDQSKVEGWRPIALLNFIARAYASLLYLKLAAPLDVVMSEAQQGFRPYRRAIDNTMTVRLLTRQRKREGRGTAALFVDLTQCFDTVPRKLVEKALVQYGVPEALRRRVWSLYEGHQFAVRRDGATSGKTSTTTGTKQGCLLSPLLYSIAANYVLERTDLGRGIAFRSGRLLQGDETRELQLDHLLYADDIVVLAEGRAELETATASLVASFEAYGLRVNYGKTKFMIFNEERQGGADHIELSGGKIERVDSFLYLGSVLDASTEDSRDILERIDKAQRRSGELGGVLNSKKISQRLKIRILRAFIYPVAAWGCETWTVKGSDAAALDTWWNKKLRQCIGITKHDHVRTEDLLQRTGEQPLSERVAQRQLRYFGHLVRYPPNRWVRLAVAQTGGSTRRGQGATATWRGEVEKILVRRRAAPQDATDRDLWKGIVAGVKTGTGARRPEDLTIQQANRIGGRRRECVSRTTENLRQ